MTKPPDHPTAGAGAAVGRAVVRHARNRAVNQFVHGRPGRPMGRRPGAGGVL
jgi:hypothetical protein